MGINYNNEPELMKKGSVLIGADQDDSESTEKWETLSDEELGSALWIQSFFKNRTSPIEHTIKVVDM